MMKKTIGVLLILSIIICHFPIAVAHQNENDHYKDLESVLFGNNSARIMGDAEKKKLVRHLEYATSLALDQFNGFKGTLLEDLRLYGVPNLPNHITDKIEEGGFNFPASGQTHRQYTHLGWTYDYDKEHRVANWPLRKQMMVDTAKRVLNCNDDEICDSFAALLYYIHVIGDAESCSRRCF